MKSHRFRTLQLAAIAGESREKAAFLGWLFSSVPGCSRHVGPQRDRREPRCGPPAAAVRVSQGRQPEHGPSLRFYPRVFEDRVERHVDSPRSLCDGQTPFRLLRRGGGRRGTAERLAVPSHDCSSSASVQAFPHQEAVVCAQEAGRLIHVDS